MKTLFKSIKKRWWFLFLALIAIVTQVYFQLQLPSFMGNIQKLLTYKTDTPLTPVIITNPISGSSFEIAEALGDSLPLLVLDQGGWMILCCTIILACAFIQFYSASSLGAFVGKDLREKMYKKVNELSLTQYNKYGTATLITRTTNDIEQIKNVTVFGTRILIMSPSYIIIALIYALSIPDPGPKLTVVLAICIPLIFIVVAIIFMFASPLFKKIQKQTDDITVVFRENLTGIRVVRAYNQQEEENKKFDKENLGMKKIITKIGRITSVASPFISVLFNVCYIAIYGLGFYLLTTVSFPIQQYQVVILSQITTISMMAQYSLQIMNSFLMFAMILIMIPQASVSLKRISEVINLDTTKDERSSREWAIKGFDAYSKKVLHQIKEDYKATHNGETLSISLLKSKFENMTEDEIKKDSQYEDYMKYLAKKEKFDKTMAELKDSNSDKYIKVIGRIFDQNPTKGVIEFENVSFQYPDSNVPTISNISFKTKPGTTTAIIGSTGSGKSSLINLIPRFYDATDGRIILDGVDITKIPEKVVRDHIGFVPQQAVLFTGTIEDNIKYGKEDATEEEILQALRVAQTEHFVSKLPDGIKTKVAQGGKNFSGGQKQRLSIARCLVRKPEIYVFDDSFSALDFKTDAKLRAELKKYTKDASVIVVAQRVSSILDADNIIVLHEGKCVAQGTHNELLLSCPVYQDIVKSQLDPEEIEKTISLKKQLSLEGGNN